MSSPFPPIGPAPHEIPEIGTVFHGQGFADKAVRHNLVPDYPAAARGSFNVGILHTSLGGYSGHDTLRALRPPAVGGPRATTTSPSATSTSVRFFEATVSQRPSAAILQGRHIRETGPKGAFLVTLRSSGPAELEFVELDVARWEMLEVDVSEATDIDAVLAAVSDSSPRRKPGLAVGCSPRRVKLVGTGEVAYALADQRQLRQEIQTIAEANNAVLNKVVNRVQPPPRPRTLRAEDRAALLAAADSPALAPSALLAAFQKLADETDTYLGNEVRLEDEAVADSDEALTELARPAASDPSSGRRQDDDAGEVVATAELRPL